MAQTLVVGELVAHLRADASQFNNTLRKASQQIDRVGQRMRALGSQLSLAVTGPIVALGVGAIKATADWETAMTNVAKTVDATDSQLKKIGNEFIALSEKIPVSANELANLGAVAGQLGISTENISKFAETAAAMGVATNLSGEEAAVALARLANITQLPQEEIERLGSTVVALGNNLATTEREILDMSLRLAATASAAGLTEAEILGFAGALSSVGIRAEAGGSAFSRVFADMASATKSGGEELEAFAKIVGVTGDKLAETFERDATEAVLMFVEGLRRIQDEGGNVFAALESVGFMNIRVSRALIAAAGSGDLFARSLALGTKAFEENTALTIEAERFYNRLAARFTIVRNRVVNLAAKFGDALRPAIERTIETVNKILDRVGNLIRKFGELDEGLRIQIVKWAAIAAAIGPAFIVLGGLLTILAPLVGLLSTTTIAMVAVGVAVVAVAKNFLGLGEIAAGIWPVISDAARTSLNFIGGIVKPVLNFIIGSFVAMGEIAFIIWDEIKIVVGAVFGFILEKAKTTLGAVATAFEQLGEAAIGFAAGLRRIFEIVAGTADEEGSNLGARIAQAMLDSFGTDYVGAFGELVGDGIKKAEEKVKAAIAKLRQLFGGAGGAGDGAEPFDPRNFTTPLFRSAVGSDKFGLRRRRAVNEAAQDMTAELKETMEREGRRAGEALIDGIIFGMDSLEDFFKNFIKTFISRTISFIIFGPLGLNIGSPSKLMVGAGHSIVEGLMVGMDEMSSLLAAQSSRIAGLPAAAAATAGPSHTFNLDLSRMPRPLTPREAAMSNEFQELIAETVRNLEEAGFRSRITR